MKIETFLNNLHFNVEKVFPENWAVDWADAPLPYKLYQELYEIHLPPEIPITFSKREESSVPKLAELGQFLWYVYGVAQYSQTALYRGSQEDPPVVMPSLRRFVPSGGALYPNEIYLYLKLAELPVGIYHYSAAHHRLVLLREGNFDSYLSRSLGTRLDMDSCFGTLFVSTVFWKNFFKYHNFSYRLQGLDTGVLIAQSLETANQMGFSSFVCYQFLDRAINHLLGISEQKESVYAVIPLSADSIFQKDKSNQDFSAESLCGELPVLEHHSYQRSKTVIDYPMLREMNEASFHQETNSFTLLERKQECISASSLETIILPFSERQIFDFSSVCRNRFSPEADFTLGKISSTQLSTLLKETFSHTYQNDLSHGSVEAESHLSVYGSFYQAGEIQNGVYRYDHCSHSLLRIAAGDYREALQSALTIDNVNLYQVPICLHVVGDKDHFIGKFGYRGYRIQQMEAGMLVQKLLLSAQALGLGGHPLLGFDAKSCDEIYRIHTKEKTCLIQIPIGPFRPRAWLKGNLHG
jgi:SagB-type dehydrogenase family enzyme